MELNRAAAARSVKWSVVENGGLALISFGSLIVYAHFVSVRDFGLFSIVLAVIELLTALVAMLFHDALVQRRDVGELHYDSAFTATLALSAALALLCCLVGPQLWRAGAPDAGPVLIWMSLCLPLTAISATLVARRRREMQFRVLAMRQLIGRTAGAAAGIALVVLGFGLWGLVAQHVLVVLFGSLVLWVQCPDRPRLRFGMREFRDLIGFGLLSTSALMVHFCIKRAFIVVSGLALGAHGAGLLNLSFRAVDTLWSLAATAVSQIALPVLSAVREDEARFRRAFASAAAQACLAMYFGFVLLAGASREVVELLFGLQWVAIAPYVTLLALQVLVQARRLLFPPVLTALGRPRDLLISHTAELAFVLAAVALFGIPSVGWALGIWLAREVVGTCIEGWMVHRASRIGMRELLGSTVVPLVAALVMLPAVWVSRELLAETSGVAVRLALLAAIGAVVYFGCVALLKRGLLIEMSHFVRSGFWQRSRA